jgi:hypothetical protein
LVYGPAGVVFPFQELTEPGGRGWLAADMAATPLARFWQPLSALPGAKGRGGVGLLRIGDRMLVVRPFRRGGAFAKVFGDRYLRPSRVHDELLLLAELRRIGVPAVEPIAAVARRRGVAWRLRLCTTWLPAALPLPAFLASFPGERRAAATAVGQLLHGAFAAGLRHPDLHLDNVLCEVRGGGVGAVLVDLDRARLALPRRPAAEAAMLVRLLRHLERHRGRLPATPSRCERMRALRQLAADRAARHALWRRLARGVRRALRLRSLPA